MQGGLEFIICLFFLLNTELTGMGNPDQPIYTFNMIVISYLDSNSQLWLKVVLFKIYLRCETMF